MLYLSQIFRYVSPRVVSSHLYSWKGNVWSCPLHNSYSTRWWLLWCYLSNVLILNPTIRKNSTEIIWSVPPCSIREKGRKRRGDMLICSHIFNVTNVGSGNSRHVDTWLQFLSSFHGNTCKARNFAKTSTRRSPVLAEEGFSSVLFFTAASSAEGSLVLESN